MTGGSPAPPLTFEQARARAEAHSPYLRALLRREADGILPLLEAGDPQSALHLALTTALARHDPDSAASSLRAAKAGVALTVALADLAGLWTLEETTSALSRAADSAIQCALDAAFAERGIPQGERQGLAVLGLGKLGSHELNYSSDVDLIVLHDPNTLPHRAQDDVDEAAVRLVRRMATLLSERTAEGYAWRVDLRLRPDPDSTPPSLRLAAAEAYYQSEALAWERAAFIRARTVAGDKALGDGLLATLTPFLWRRSLDYSALAEIREVSARIRDHFGEVEAFGPGFDLKRGRGGIREVEFFAQTHQLIFGGREPALRRACNARRAERPCSRRPDQHGGSRNTLRRLSAPANPRTSAADGRRPADPHDPPPGRRTKGRGRADGRARVAGCRPHDRTASEARRTHL